MKSPERETDTPGSVWKQPGNWPPYRNDASKTIVGDGSAASLSFRYVRTFGVTEEHYISATTHDFTASLTFLRQPGHGRKAKGTVSRNFWQIDHPPS